MEQPLEPSIPSLLKDNQRSSVAKERKAMTTLDDAREMKRLQNSDC